MTTVVFHFLGFYYVNRPIYIIRKKLPPIRKAAKINTAYYLFASFAASFFIVHCGVCR